MAFQSAVAVQAITYAGTLVIFAIVFYVDMPKLVFPVVGNLLGSPSTLAPDIDVARYLMLVMWGLHFVRRTVEVIWVNIYYRHLSVMEIIGAPSYYWTFSLFIAWSIDEKTYSASYIPLIALGGVLFVLGEIGNCWSHIQLRLFRTRIYDDSERLALKSGHVMPHGGLFELVDCPHYFCEILSWLGYFLVAFTLMTLLLLLGTVVTLVTYALKKHRQYVAEFDGLEGRPTYPRGRKILVPFVF